MSSETPNATGGSLYTFPDLPQTHTIAEIASEADVLHRQARDLQGRSGELRKNSLILDLERRRNAEAKKAPKAMLEELSDLGFAWRDIAKIARVSVAAVTKWRRGERVTESNRRRLAEVLALVDMLTDRMIDEPVSWLEMRQRDNVALTAMDMFAAGRSDLVLELASDYTDGVALDAAFDAFEPNWRETRVDDAFETFVADDGVVSIRPKS
ncbi:hypothetical protein ACFWXT_29460 [Bacillus cereus]|uniref:hypothetical protein n=1 Tax=Bacillus cereus TaxID=1396 RepID=UPI00366D2E4A